jgi:hypothetical protein
MRLAFGSKPDATYRIIKGLRKFWTGHADESTSDLYDKISEDVVFRRMWAEKCGFDFDLPSVVPNLRRIIEKVEANKAA